MGFCHLQLQDFCLVVFDTNEFSSLHSQLLNAIAILQIIMGHFLGETDVPSLTLTEDEWTDNAVLGPLSGRNQEGKSLASKSSCLHSTFSS